MTPFVTLTPLLPLSPCPSPPTGLTGTLATFPPGLNGTLVAVYGGGRHFTSFRKVAEVPLSPLRGGGREGSHMKVPCICL